MKKTILIFCLILGYAIYANALDINTSGGSGSGTGDVTGPSASADGELVLFDSTTGKAIKRSNTLNGSVSVASGVVSATTGTNCVMGFNESGTYGCYTAVNTLLSEVISTASTTLTLAQVSNSILSNYGETDDANLILTLPDLDAYPGAKFSYKIATAMATFDTCVKAAADNAFVLDGVAGTDAGCICNGSPTARDKLTCVSTTNGASTVEIDCETGRGTWALVASGAGSCP